MSQRPQPANFQLMNHFFQHLSQPEYVHVLINPIPVYGLAVGIITLIVAFFFRVRAALVPGLIAIAFSGAMAWPVYEYGEKSYDRVYSMVNTEGDAWLNTHMHRAEKLIYVFYALAALAVAAILLPIKWPHSLLPLAIATLIFGAATLGVGGWIAYAGGKIRHPEFRSRDEPAPESAVRETDMD
jgi:glucan phosphoethanolaminetransferase (alkaline phosphatase superfamily)